MTEAMRGDVRDQSTWMGARWLETGISVRNEDALIGDHGPIRDRAEAVEWELDQGSHTGLASALRRLERALEAALADSEFLDEYPRYARTLGRLERERGALWDSARRLADDVEKGRAVDEVRLRGFLRRAVRHERAENELYQRVYWEDEGLAG